jgi:nicotinate-nucleotide adenylyltransferase
VALQQPQSVVAQARSVGVLGGTFNPPHLGHLALARQALAQVRLERVVLMPANSSPHKPGAEDPGSAHRLAMCRLLVAGAEKVAVCALEVERGGMSFTVDTLQALHASHPDAELTFIVGADTVRTLPTWREPTKLLELARFAVAARAGAPREQVQEAFASLAGVDHGAPPEDTSSAGTTPFGTPGTPSEHVHPTFLDMPLMEVSSSLVRERAARGEPVEDLVGEAVAAYISEHRLYGR